MNLHMKCKDCFDADTSNHSIWKGWRRGGKQISLPMHNDKISEATRLDCILQHFCGASAHFNICVYK